MKLSTILVVLAAVAATAQATSDDTFAVGVPESISNSLSATALGNPVHVSIADLEARTALGNPVSVNSGSFALGNPVSVGHPASSTGGEKTPQELALESIVRIYGVALPTPAPTTYVTPAPTSPTPAPTYTTPAPTVPTPAPTSTSVDDSNASIKQFVLPAETPAATLATEVPELLRDSEAAAVSTSLAASDSADDSPSIVLPVAMLGCVAAALAVAVVVLVQKRAQSAKKTASPTSAVEVDYNNEMITPV